MGDKFVLIEIIEDNTSNMNFWGKFLLWVLVLWWVLLIYYILKIMFYLPIRLLIDGIEEEDKFKIVISSVILGFYLIVIIVNLIINAVH